MCVVVYVWIYVLLSVLVYIYASTAMCVCIGTICCMYLSYICFFYILSDRFVKGDWIWGPWGDYRDEKIHHQWMVPLSSSSMGSALPEHPRTLICIPLFFEMSCDNNLAQIAIILVGLVHDIWELDLLFIYLFILQWAPTFGVWWPLSAISYV